MESNSLALKANIDLLYLYLKKLITKGVSSFKESEQKSK